MPTPIDRFIWIACCCVYVLLVSTKDLHVLSCYRICISLPEKIRITLSYGPRRSIQFITIAAPSKVFMVGAMADGLISAPMLLANAPVDSSQRVSILTAASAASDVVSPTELTDKMLSMDQYESVMFLRQCDMERVYVTQYVLRCFLCIT